MIPKPRILLTLALSLLCTVSVLAQLDRGTITGIVTDPTGAVIPRVKVTIQNTATGASYESISNEEGTYTVPNLPIGSYQITFEAASFRKLLRSNVTLGVTAVLRVDAKLEVGSLDESVQVNDEVPRIQTDVPEVSTTMSNKQMVDVPFAFSGGRLMENFTYKTHPGVYGNRWENNINGAPYFSRETLVDGASTTTRAQGGMVLSSVSLESVQEFKVQASGMSAEFGRTQSGVLNYVLKSGTNDIHGSLYGSLRNEALNANNFANNARGAARPLDRKQNYAGSFGGPLVLPKLYDGHNRSFFYASYEHYRDRNLVFGSPNRTAPLPEFYQGDFSRLLGSPTGQTDGLGRPVLRGAIYDPATFRQLPGGRWIGDPFPNNQIPVERFSAVSKRLNAIATQHYLPTVRDSSGQIPLVNNMFAPINSIPKTDDYMISVKGDHIINDKHKLSGSYGAEINLREITGLVSGVNQIVGLFDIRERDGGPLSYYYDNLVTGHLARLSWDWTLSPRVLNHVTVSYNRQTFPNSSIQREVDGAKELGITGLSTRGYPIVNWGSGPFVTLTAPGNAIDDRTTSPSWGVLETISFSKGSHFMKAGVDVRRNHHNVQPNKGGTFNFEPRATAIPNEPFAGNLTGYSFASYLLGIVDSGDLTDPVVLGARRHFYSLFLQDDYKVSQKLTLNLGLRWEYQPPGFEVADRFSSWNPSKPDPATGRLGAYDFAGDCNVCTGKSSFGRRSLRDFGPRVGFAYRPVDKWTVRGAWGIFYAADIFNGTLGTPLGKATNVQAGGTYLLSADAVNPWAGIFNWDSGFPASRFVAPSYDVSWGNLNRPGMLDPNYGRTGYSHQWNLNIQREIFWKFVLDVGYVGNKSTGLRLGEMQRINQLPSSALGQYGRNLNNAVRSPADAAANGIAYPYPGFQGTVASALRPYPQVQGNQTINVYGSPLGFSTHHALQVTANRQFSQGLTTFVNYVWSKTMTNMRSQLANSNPNRPLDYYSLRLEKAVAEYDVPHFLKVFADYELPIGRGKAIWGNANRVANAILGGWALSGILNYGSGRPLRFPGSFPLAGGWNGATNRANIQSGNLIVDNYDKNAFDFRNQNAPGNTYLVKTQFSDPAPLTLGSSAPFYDQVRDFGVINEDIALQKNHYFSENRRLQFRADFLNGFNRHTLGGINTTVTSPTFGQVTSVSGNREIQLTVRFDF